MPDDASPKNEEAQASAVANPDLKDINSRCSKCSVGLFAALLMVTCSAVFVYMWHAEPQELENWKSVFDHQKLSSSRTSSGRSSHLFLESNAQAHSANLKSNKGQLDDDQLNGDTSEFLAEFWADYGSYFGCDESQMRLVDINRDDSSGLATYVFQQALYGFDVFGGTVVLTIGGSNLLIQAAGHALPIERVDEDLTNFITVESSEAIETIQSLIEVDTKKTRPDVASYKCSSSDIAVTVVWHRGDLKYGGEGDVKLAYHLRGICTSLDEPPLVFDGFVDTKGGAVLEFVRKEDAIMSKRDQERLSSLKKTSLVSPLSRGNLRSELSRKLAVNYAPDMSVLVYEYSNGCCNGALLFSEDTQDFSAVTDVDIIQAVEHTVGSTRMMRAVTNQEYLSFKKVATPLKIAVHYNAVNAYFDGSDITIGYGLAVDDVTAHEWAHGYTQYTSDLQYSYLSGALNEAYSDIIGETYDLRDNNNGGDPKIFNLRDSNQKCTPHGGSTDDSTRWIMGEDIAIFNGVDAIRDMYYPECFGDPSSTYSNAFYCGASDYGGVHWNSGVINRLYAVLVDGGVYKATSAYSTPISVSAIGLTKAINLFWSVQLLMSSTSQFNDFGTFLGNMCRAKIGSVAFVPDAATGDSVPSGVSLTSADCDEVDKAIIGSGVLREYNEMCYVDPNACNVQYPSYIGDGWCDKTGGYNTAQCNWDGGDCCIGSCVSSTYTCGVNGYQCLDPAYSPTQAPTKSPTLRPTRKPTEAQLICVKPSLNFNGVCNEENNNAACDYDGGDCCRRSCLSNPDKKKRKKCGKKKSYNCIDPDYA